MKFQASLFEFKAWNIELRTRNSCFEPGKSGVRSSNNKVRNSKNWAPSRKSRAPSSVIRVPNPEIWSSDLN